MRSPKPGTPLSVPPEQVEKEPEVVSSDVPLEPAKPKVKEPTKVPTASGHSNPEIKGSRPCDWNIYRQEDGSIIAKNDVTQAVWKGSMVDYNKALRG